MTEKVNPWIKGTLPRGRHFVYQALLLVAFFAVGLYVAVAIEQKWGTLALIPALPAGIVIIGSHWNCMVKRLHDAGRSGWWVLLLPACYIVAKAMDSGHRVNEVQEALFIIFSIGGLIAQIVIFVMPPKKDNNPYKPVINNVGVSKDNGTTPLQKAATDGRENSPRKHGGNSAPSHQAAVGGQTAMMDSLDFFGADVIIKAYNGGTAFHIAARLGDIKMILANINNGSYIAARDKSDLTALHYAALQGHAEIARALVNAGALMLKCGKYGWTPMHLSAREGHTETALVFVKAGANIDAKNIEGATPLHIAAWFGHAETADALIKKGADTDAKTKDGFAPLHLASAKGQTKVALALVKAGAGLNVRANNGKTPLDYAIEKHGKDSAIALFLQGAMEKQRNKDRQESEELLRELE